MPRILVVDDNPEILIVVEASLAASGFEVTTTPSPEDALRLLEGQNFDAAVLDVMMPRMSGYELLSRLRKMPGGEQLPVLFLSALTDAEARVQGLRLGADDYLGKPFVADELVLRVQRLVRSQMPPTQGLHGSLENFSLSSLVQNLSEDGQNGDLEVRGAHLDGTMVFRDGRLVAARCGALRGQEAALALVDADRGHFRFLPSRQTNHAEARAIDWQSILLEAAWTEDELDRRRSHLPRFEAPLRLCSPTPPQPPADLLSLPILEVYRWVAAEETPTLEVLQSRCQAAPKRVQLALAWLIEQGLVEPAGLPFEVG